MNLTRSQYESVFGRTVLYFSLLVGLATVIELTLAFSLGGPYDSFGQAVGFTLFATAFGGFVSILFAAIGSGVMGLVFGIGLAALVARVFRNVTDWRRHFIAYFAIGALAAVVPVGLYFWAALSSESLRQFAGDWLTILDLGVVIILAGLSTSLAWHHVWRRAEVAEPTDATVEAVDA